MKRLLLLGGIVAVAILAAGGAGARTGAAPQFLGAWTFADGPNGVAANAQGDVWVSFGDTPRIARYDVAGHQQVSVTLGITDQHKPRGIATDAAGNAYVADTQEGAILKFSRAGSLLATWTLPGGAIVGEGIALDSSGNVFVADDTNQDIAKFSSAGTFVTSFGGGGQISPRGVATDAGGNIYVVDSEGGRVVKFSPSGTQLGVYGSGYGAGNGQFYLAMYDAVDSGGNLFVSDENGQRIEEFAPGGQYMNAWGSGGSANGEFSGQLGVSVDVAGNIYVADWGNNRIQKFFAGLNPCYDLTGTHLSSCQQAQATCMAKLVPQDEADCLNQTKTQYDQYRGQSSKAASAKIVASPEIVTANGKNAAKVKVTLLDSSGSPVSGKSVKLERALAQRITGVTISPAAATTNSAGIATFTVRSQHKGVVHFVAVDVTDGNLRFAGGVVTFR